MEHLQLIVTQTRQETSDTKTYFVREVNGASITYKAGQFLTLLVNLQGREVRRSYSISSAPGVDEDLFFTIKRIENGELSRHLFDRLKTGDLIESLPPSGRFIIEKTDNDLCVFIAAGSGITPVFSLVKQVLYRLSNTNVFLIYQNRNEQESIFRSELLQLQQQFGIRFSMREIFSQPADHTRPSQRLNNNLLERILLQYVQTTAVRFYLCGPAAFMRMVQFTLKVMGFSTDQIKTENFFATAPPPPFITNTLPHQVTIHYRHKTHYLQVAYPQNILTAALNHHIPLPYSCRGGRCSTCTAHCTSGRVKMSINDVLTPKDLSEGLILTCVAYPETDVELTFENNGAGDILE